MRLNVNHEQFITWIESYTDALYKRAYYKTKSRETAEDLVQDTFLAAYSSLLSFEGKSEPKTWLFGILNHKITDFYRSKLKIKATTDIIPEENAEEITSNMFDRTGKWNTSESISSVVWKDDLHLLDNPVFLKIFYECIDDLPTKWRYTIQYKYLMQKTSDDICQELNLSTTNYWQVVRRAKLLLKKCIEINWNE